ncbi:hypothetical protein GCM10009785_23250 [Brooklawnia cerclae]|uniref:YbaB/EbfC DNA-binding family protein n=1 Tax=Brooklawnia cerclae TaxID=349934 RepID=A0ABX0SGC2_9ACTN|nr:hypothetical protein [Brooklawnia cerclae]NIH57040.1 hypothetical protein [Brooklawnia cerclae]
MTHPAAGPDALIARWRAQASALADRSRALGEELARTQAVATDGLTQLKVSASGTLAAIGFADTHSSISAAQLSTSFLRVHEAATRLLWAGEGIDDGKLRSIRVVLASDAAGPGFPLHMSPVPDTTVTPPIFRPPADALGRVRRLNRTGPGGLPRRTSATREDYDTWMRGRLERIVRDGDLATTRARHVIGHADSPYVEIEVDARLAPSSIRFHAAALKTPSLQLADDAAAVYGEAVADARRQLDEVFRAVSSDGEQTSDDQDR